MGKVEEVLKSEILRLAKKATKGTLSSLSKNLRELKRNVSHLSKTVAVLEKKVAKYEQREQAQKTQLDVPKEEVRAARLSAGLIKKLRKRLGITQGNLALLAGVSKGAVVAWEAGRSAPRAENKATLVALRKLSKRDAKKLLADKGKIKPKPKSKPKKKAAKKKAPKRGRRRK